MVKVVPQFQDIFAGFGAELPAFTLFVIGISDFMVAFWLDTEEIEGTVNILKNVERAAPNTEQQLLWSRVCNWKHRLAHNSIGGGSPEFIEMCVEYHANTLEYQKKGGVDTLMRLVERCEYPVYTAPPDLGRPTEPKATRPRNELCGAKLARGLIAVLKSSPDNPNGHGHPDGPVVASGQTRFLLDARFGGESHVFFASFTFAKQLWCTRATYTAEPTLGCGGISIDTPLVQRPLVALFGEWHAAAADVAEATRVPVPHVDLCLLELQWSARSGTQSASIRDIIPLGELHCLCNSRRRRQGHRVGGGAAEASVGADANGDAPADDLDGLDEDVAAQAVHYFVSVDSVDAASDIQCDGPGWVADDTLLQDDDILITRAAATVVVDALLASAAKDTCAVGGILQDAAPREELIELATLDEDIGEKAIDVDVEVAGEHVGLDPAGAVERAADSPEIVSSTHRSVCSWAAGVSKMADALIEAQRLPIANRCLSLVYITPSHDAGPCLRWMFWDDIMSMQGRFVTVTGRKIGFTPKSTTSSAIHASSFAIGDMKLLIHNSGGQMVRGTSMDMPEPSIAAHDFFVDVLFDNYEKVPEHVGCEHCERHELDDGNGGSSSPEWCALCNCSWHSVCSEVVASGTGTDGEAALVERVLSRCECLREYGDRFCNICHDMLCERV